MKMFEKLDETKYFLEQMRLNIKDRRAFKHNLSAFLSSGRSVTFVLQNEYAENTKFREWYEKKKEEMKTDNLLNFFVNKRNYVIKEGPVELRGKIFLEVHDAITISESVTVIKKRPDGTEEIVHQTEPEIKARAKPKEIKSSYQLFFEDYPDKDILTLCEEYVERLTKIVEEAKKIVSSG